MSMGMMEQQDEITDSPRSSDQLTGTTFEVGSEQGAHEEGNGKQAPPCPLPRRVSGIAVIIIIIVLAVICFPLCFILFYELQKNEIEIVDGIPKIPTLSLTGGYWPNSAIFTLFLHIYSFLSIILFSMVAEIYAKRIENLPAETDKGRRTQLYVANGALYWLAMIFSLFLLLTGTVVITESEVIHAVIAIIMFVAGVCHIAVYTFTLGLLRVVETDNRICRVVLDSNIAESLDKSIGLRWQFAAFLLAVPVNVAALLTGFIVGLSCGQEDLDCLALSVQMVVVVEYTTATALLLYVVGFLYAPEMHHTYCQVLAETEKKQGQVR